VDFDADGNRLSPPQRTVRVSYFVNLSYYHGSLSPGEMTISHVEFVTLSGLGQFLRGLCVADELVDRFFPLEDALRLVRKL
jgi:hypothetical protein